MSYAAVSDNEPVHGDRYTNQLMALVGERVSQHVAGQVNVLLKKIAALQAEVEGQAAEMATMRSALAALGHTAELAELRDELATLHSRDDASEATAAALRAEIAAVNKSMPHYVGAWREGGTWAENEIVTFHGGMWICTANTSRRPGSGDDCGWQLCVKAGRAARSESRGHSGTAEPRK